MYPDHKQCEQVIKTLGSCRYVYNLFLDVWNTTYKYTGSGMSYNSCSASMTELKKVLPWLKEADSTALQSSLRNLSDGLLLSLRRTLLIQYFIVREAAIPIHLRTIIIPFVSWIRIIFLFQSLERLK